MNYVNILGLVRVGAKVFPGVCFTTGVDVQMVEQGCLAPEGAQTMLFKDGNRVLAKINVSAIANAWLSECAEEEFALLEASEIVEEPAVEEPEAETPVEEPTPETPVEEQPETQVEEISAAYEENLAVDD